MDWSLTMADVGALDQLMALPGERAGSEMATLAALAEASAAIARLDQALAGHPLRQSLPSAARCGAPAGGRGRRTDRSLALGGNARRAPSRVDPYLRIIDRGRVLIAARAALTLQWLVEPDFDREGEVQCAEAVLATQPGTLPPTPPLPNRHQGRHR
jgi:hypothetical protein